MRLYFRVHGGRAVARERGDVQRERMGGVRGWEGKRATGEWVSGPGTLSTDMGALDREDAAWIVSHGITGTVPLCKVSAHCSMERPRLPCQQFGWRAPPTTFC